LLVDKPEAIFELMHLPNFGRMNRIEQLNEFLKESPGDNFLTHALALEYIKQGNDEEARYWFEKNLEGSPQYVPTYYHLGKLLERNGYTEEAIRVYGAGMEQAKAVGDQHAFSELRSVYEELTF